jgi:hypothetical protein
VSARLKHPEQKRGVQDDQQRRHAPDAITDNFPPGKLMGIAPFADTALIAPYQAGVADNVCNEDRRQFSPREAPRSLQRIVEGAGLLGNEASSI